MRTRPLILSGSEASANSMSVMESSGFHFDGALGLWRDEMGQLAIHAYPIPSTTATATREGLDQSEHATFSTTMTETQEGIDQAERVEPVE